MHQRHPNASGWSSNSSPISWTPTSRYEFGYYEYTGENFDADMAQLAKEPRNIAWLAVCDAMQKPLPGAKSWTQMKCVYYNP